MKILRLVNGLVALLYGGWVLAHLWRWFVAPVFGVAMISAAEAAGLLMVAGLMTHQFSQADFAQAKAEPTEAEVAAWLWPWLKWTFGGLFGWLWYALAF